MKTEHEEGIFLQNDGKQLPGYSAS